MATSSPSVPALLARIRLCLAIMIVGLVLSGVTAFPLVWEVERLQDYIGSGTAMGRTFPHLAAWIEFVHAGLQDTSHHWPFVFYGTDWLAFAHLVIAAAFIGPWLDPVRNKWVLQWGLLACIGIIPLAFIAGQVRGIPLFWRLIDCSFGVLGAIPLLLALRYVHKLENPPTTDS